ncbi:MAG: phosphopyruvate hydratase [Bdellovibrionota bacterium]
MATIRNVKAREVLDSRGFPTVEAEVIVDDPHHKGEYITERAIVPSGASTGEGEALELRDADQKRYLGKGVLKSVTNIREKITPAIIKRDFPLQSLLDDALRELDGTPNKSNLGANSILAVSMAFARAQAAVMQKPLYRYISSIFDSSGATLPVPFMNIINGGKHADSGLAIQEFMIVPAGFERFSDALRAGVEVFHRLKKILHDKKLSTGVGDEGGFAPVFDDEKPHEQALSAIMQAIKDAGYKAGTEIFLALDCAASEFISTEPVASGVRYSFENKNYQAGELIEIYSKWVDAYPIISIEDGLAEHDWEGWSMLTAKLGKRCQLVGDDLFVTNPSYLRRGIESCIANAILIKLNQIGTVTETLETMKLAHQSGYGIVTSHRSGETEDTFIADLAVGTDCGQIKTGSLSRTDRIAKYNQLLRIEEQLENSARFIGRAVFK